MHAVFKLKVWCAAGHSARGEHDVAPTIVLDRNRAAISSPSATTSTSASIDIETAMTKGVNYPKGLLAWGDEIGPPVILARGRRPKVNLPTGMESNA